MRILLLSLVLGLLACGCASKGLKPVSYVAGRDPAPMARALEEYNGFEGVYRVLGNLKLSDSPAISYGGRAEPGAGARVDGVAKSSTKLLFSLGCLSSVGCEVFFPDEFVVYREEGRVFSDWVSRLVTGRVALIGEPRDAGVSASGEPVVRYADQAGNWQLVVFDGELSRPEVIFYGDAVNGAKLRVVFSDWFDVGGKPFPRRTVMTGSDSGQELVVESVKVERSAGPGEDTFRLRLPEGAPVKEASGRDTWKRMGMFWIPQD